MRTVEDEAGRRYLLRKASSDAWLVRDLRTGREDHLPAETLTVVEGESPLDAAATAVPQSHREALDLPGPRAVGLLATVHADEPVPVRDLLDLTDLCESDLHGLVGELVAAGHLRETSVAGERAYETTPRTAALLVDGPGD